MNVNVVGRLDRFGSAEMQKFVLASLPNAVEFSNCGLLSPALSS